MKLTRDGYGVVEPNHLSAPRTGQVYAQLPAAEDIEILENGMFACYDYANGEVNFDGTAPWMLVFNEEKLYDERKQMHKHFAQKVEDSYDGKIYPRLLVPVLGDIFTTNMVKDAETEDGVELSEGDVLKITTGTGILSTDGDVEAPEFTVVKCYIMPDGQPGVKLQLTKEQ